jgi:hypothetical protein
MNFQSTAAALRTEILAQWALSTYAAIPIVPENRKSPTDTNATWIRLTIVPQMRDPVAYGNVRNWRTFGAIYFQIFVPTGEGDALARKIADVLGGFLEGRVISGVSVRSVTFTGNIGVDGQWTQYNVRADYDVDELK